MPRHLDGSATWLGAPFSSISVSSRRGSVLHLAIAAPSFPAPPHGHGRAARPLGAPVGSGRSNRVPHRWSSRRRHEASSWAERERADRTRVCRVQQDQGGSLARVVLDLRRANPDGQLRCDGHHPCARCVRTGKPGECVFLPSMRGKTKRKKWVPGAGKRVLKGS